MLLDTHIWIWTAEGDRKRIGRKARRALSRDLAMAKLTLSTASFFEVAAIHTAGRVQFAQPIESWIRESLERGEIRVVQVTQAIAVDAGLIPVSALADPVDRLLVATARALRLPLVTRDGRILDYARETGAVQVVDASL